MDFALILWMIVIVCIILGILLLLLDNLSLRNENRMLRERNDLHSLEYEALRVAIARATEDQEHLKILMQNAGLKV